jgi:hypothetical protein
VGTTTVKCCGWYGWQRWASSPDDALIPMKHVHYYMNCKRGGLADINTTSVSDPNIKMNATSIYIYKKKNEMKMG